jgi:hypothetical protein
MTMSPETPATPISPHRWFGFRFSRRQVASLGAFVALVVALQVISHRMWPLSVTVPACLLATLLIAAAEWKVSGDALPASKVMRRLHGVIEINLLLWMAVTLMVYRGDADARLWAAGGFVFSALAQHWAYYAVKNAGRMERLIA